MKASILFIAVVLTTVFADDMGTDPCPNDTTGYCMNMYAIKYTNQLRGRKLMSGSMAMFRNAMQHSIDQDRKGTIFHQPIGQGVRVGSGECADTLSGENVAYYENSRIKNAAMYCVLDLWKNSPGHYRNMVNEGFTTVVIAIYRNNGRVTCTQTFSREPRKGTGNCAAALPSSANERPTPTRSTPEPQQPKEELMPERMPKEEKPKMVEEIPVVENRPKMEEKQMMKEDKPKMEEKKMMNEDKPKMNSRRKMEKSPKNKRPMKYKLHYKSLTIVGKNGKKKTYVQRCFRSRCRYCNKATKRCLGGRRSFMIDYFFKYLRL